LGTVDVLIAAMLEKGGLLSIVQSETERTRDMRIEKAKE